ncbi:leukocyte surface antigen CD53-like [Ochlerotatus camptorhynchus]|uniref:leukocyte surface antigen CD53-like n=1 Tax=Ochlerotatus camptorhynchus TaxID=644619 RepID=UPI0031CFF13B
MTNFHPENSQPLSQQVTQQQPLSRKTLSIVKYSVLVLTGMCSILEIIQIVLGARAGNVFADFYIFLDGYFHSLTEFILAVGIIMLIIALFGSVGIILENVMVIMIYIILFSILVIMETIVAILAYILTNQVENMVDVRMNYAFSQFRYDPNVRASIHFMQRTLECCGIHNYTDWVEFNPDERIPNSCFTSLEESSAPFPQGCFNQLSQVIEYVINLIASGTTIIIIFQIICIVSAAVFMIQIKNFKKQQALRNSPSTDGITMHTLPSIIEEKGRF